MTPDDHLVSVAETIEAESLLAYVNGAPDHIRHQLGSAGARIAGGVAVGMRSDRSGFWTRTVGLGVTTPVTAAVLDEVVAFYRSEGIQQASLQIAPSLLPPDWDELAARHGLLAGRTWVKLGAQVEEIGPASTELLVGPLPKADFAPWATVILHSFGMPTAGMTEMMCAAASQPAYLPFGAWYGDAIVGGGNLFVHGRDGLLSGAGIDPAYRGRGAQSALISARARAARQAGCRRLFAETGMPAGGATNPSLNNLRRLGLQDLYLRQNWAWRDSH
ncbi:GNAT family N-acetyltransferase [Actinoplanes sp. NPDC049548]|uniref:GNAT family N-acetyltransferase n=1 Tax=Actinoplanes sp. NPDC049548 TaxID=3155152 RepID=UPI003444678C